MNIVQFPQANPRTNGYKGTHGIGRHRSAENHGYRDARPGNPGFHYAHRMDGVEVCRRLREWSQVPIIMPSARMDENDKVKCLYPGADDDITKLFGTGEMIARINAIMRPTESMTIPPILHSFARGDLQINFTHR